MKLSLVLLAIALPALGALACGGSRRGPEVGLSIAAHDTSWLRGDEDDDDGAGESASSGHTSTLDGDIDLDNDHTDNVGKGYYDRDDEPIRAFGHLASSAQVQAVSALVARYYTVARASRGSALCSMMSSVQAASIPEVYGGGRHRANTCASVTSSLLKQMHSRLTVRRMVVAVRVAGSRGFVLLGSHTTLAEYLQVELEHGGWRIAGLIPLTLP